MRAFGSWSGLFISLYEGVDHVGVKFIDGAGIQLAQAYIEFTQLFRKAANLAIFPIGFQHKLARPKSAAQFSRVVSLPFSFKNSTNRSVAIS